MGVTVVLQARTNSSRLPGKVLLPINGLPLVVLAARRAANSGRRVLVVTSNQESDDTLCDELARCEVEYFRGSLENTLERFVKALSGMDDDQIVVRLTGDNVFPDGAFVDEMVEAFLVEDKGYLCCMGDESGLPYGLTAEVTRLGHLRYAHQQTNSQYDREHVTPLVINRFGRSYFTAYRNFNMGHFRCTVDTFDDYLNMSSVFRGVAEPENVGFLALVERLKGRSSQPTTGRSARKFILGTAQLGLDYGISNTSGIPSQGEAEEIIKTAIIHGVEWIDSARAYGKSEDVVGKALTKGWGSRVCVVTKLSPLDELSKDSSKQLVKASVQKSIFHSCYALKQESLEVLMLHRAAHLTAWGGAVIDCLLGFRNQGLIKRVGVSVQSPEELKVVLDSELVSFVQLPFNLLDHRWLELIPKIKHARDKRNLIVHVRSTYLQGLLLSKSHELWNKANCTEPKKVVDWLDKEANSLGLDIQSLCLAYVAAKSWIDGVVVGIETHSQLMDSLSKFNVAALTVDQMAHIEQHRPILSENTLNPSLWRL